MGFFKEFKDDLSQAVNELLPEDLLDDNQVVNTLEIESEDSNHMNEGDEEMTNEFEDDNLDMDILDAILNSDDNAEEDLDEFDILTDLEEELTESEELKDTIAESEIEQPVTEEPAVSSQNRTEEVTVITKGTIINGSIIADGSLEVMGTIKGDVECQGKLSIIGNVTGNSMATEVYVGTKRLEGSINSEGSVKIGLGSVVIGDITASSAVIAGAVKGEIDINGPVVIDSSAVIKGNIKAQSIQINNGAVIEGFCSLSYASIDIDNIFE